MAKRKVVETGKGAAPSAQYIDELYRWKLAQQAESRLRLVSTNFRALTRLEHDVNIPEQYRAISKQVKSPFIRDTWQRVTAALTHNEPTAHVEPLNDTKAAHQAANIAERWTIGFNEKQNGDLGEDVFFESARALIRDGESVIKHVLRADAWANFPTRRDDEEADSYTQRAEDYRKSYKMPTPFAWRVIDRQTCVFEDGEYGDGYAIERAAYPVPYLVDRFKVVRTESDGRQRLKDPKYVLGGRPGLSEGLGSTGTAVKTEYWSQDWWSVLIDGEEAPGFPCPNPYGRIPYFRAKAPDSESILYALMFLVPRLDELLTMKLNWSVLGAYPTPIWETEPGQLMGDVPLTMLGGTGAGPNNPGDAVVWRPGKQLDPPPGKKLTFLVPPPVGKDLNDLAMLFRELIDIAGIPSVFRGVGASGQSGYAVNQLSAAATLTYRRLALSLAKQAEQACEFRWHLIENCIKQPVYCLGVTDDSRAWLGLSPDGSVTDYTAPVTMLGPLTIQYRPILPSDEQARVMVATELVGAGLNSRRYAMETHLQIEDPESMLDEIAAERALEKEPLASMIEQEALRKAGILPDPQSPASQLVRPDGSPLVPAQQSGAAAAGLPFVPGLNGPLTPPTPATPPIQAGGQNGRAAGAYPGQPPAQPGRVPF